MQRMKDRKPGTRNGSVLVLVVVSLLILTAMGVGLLAVGYGSRLHAVRTKTEAVAMLAAEGGYEKAVFWMSQQEDMLNAVQQGVEGLTGTVDFSAGYSDYEIAPYSFVGSRPVYRVTSVGHSGKFTRTVDVFVVQAASGWDMGICRVPLGPTTTYPVNFADGEIIDLPLHVNDLKDNPDNRDIYIYGSPRFLQAVAMGESRYTDSEYDKYYDVMDLFEDGIYFDQPDSRVTDEESIESKIARFRASTKSNFTFQPDAPAPIPASVRQPAVQLEFYVENGVGKVRVTNNCTVLGYQRTGSKKTLDYKVQQGHQGEKYETYQIYAYHYIAEDAEADGDRFTRQIEDTYVTQSFGDIQSEPGGQIFVDGNVIIGGDKSLHNEDQVVKGKITVAATGNIWVADSVIVDGQHDGEGKPAMDNPNVLGLIAQGVVKVVDPGMSAYETESTNLYPGPPDEEEDDFEYAPIGRPDGGDSEVYDRHLPDPMVVEAAITVGGGGWGAENVQWGPYGGRKEIDGDPDRLIVRGTITEAVRGVVGLIGEDGFVKQYYMDARLLEGIVPGDVWLRGKYIPAPAGWHDYRQTK